MTEQDLLEIYGGIAFEKQYNITKIIGEKAWGFDMGKGTITFDEEQEIPVQLIGSLSYSQGSWLWAWANVQSNLPEHLTKEAFELKKYGDEQSIDLLANETFPAQKNHLHRIGSIASGMFGSSGYYIADYGEGALLLTLKDETLEGTKTSAQDVIKSFTQLISLFILNHKNAFEHYVKAKGMPYTFTNNTIEADYDGTKIVAEFDETGRLTNLSTTLKS